jgi:hypothetical protein
MELLTKSVIALENNLQQNNLKYSKFDDLAEGDIVESTTMTNSQKYFYRYGYEEYNMTKLGILINKNNKYPEESIILMYNGDAKTYTKANLFRDPGTSGCVSFRKYLH